MQGLLTLLTFLSPFITTQKIFSTISKKEKGKCIRLASSLTAQR